MPYETFKKTSWEPALLAVTALYWWEARAGWLAQDSGGWYSQLCWTNKLAQDQHDKCSILNFHKILIIINFTWNWATEFLGNSVEMYYTWTELCLSQESKNGGMIILWLVLCSVINAGQQPKYTSYYIYLHKLCVVLY